MKDLIEMLDRAEKLDEGSGAGRNDIKYRINELIDQVDWTRWQEFTSTGDIDSPQVKRSKTVENGIRVDVYLGWDYGSKLGYKEYETQVAKPKFDALRSIVEKNEPTWSIKFTKSYGSRGVSWTNYWAQITVKQKLNDSTQNPIAESARGDGDDDYAEDFDEASNRALEPDENLNTPLTSIDVFKEAKNRLPYVTKASGTNDNFEIEFDDDMSYEYYIIRGKLVNGRYDMEIEVKHSGGGYFSRPYSSFYNFDIAPKSICTLFDRWTRSYNNDGQTSGSMRMAPVLKGWHASYHSTLFD